MNKLVDTHTHITPNVDDGSTSMEMSLEMLRTEAAQGGSCVFLTPHSGYFTSATYRNINAKMESVRQAAAEMELPVRIYKGCEIYTYGGNIERILQDLKDGILPSLNGTRYVLAEFDVHIGLIEESKYCLRRYLDEGWIPIIAHAERYGWEFASVENISVLKEMGCLVQVNFYDLYEEPDESIRTLAQDLLKAELVDLMGSDAHRMTHREPALTQGVNYIRAHCREEYAEDILWRNAERMLEVE